LYELADAAWVAENEPAEEGQERGTEVAATDSAGIDMEDVDTPIPMPKTAEGFVWRRISPAACEVTCDIFGALARRPQDLALDDCFSTSNMLSYLPQTSLVERTRLSPNPP